MVYAKILKKIGPEIIKIYHIYNIVLRSSSSSLGMHSVQLINKFAVSVVLWDYTLANNGPAMTYLWWINVFNLFN